MTYQYKTNGVCAIGIEVELDGDIIERVTFQGGCNGNAAGISSLVKGMSAAEVIKKFQGTPCGRRATSCPDQLSIALSEAIDKARREEMGERSGDA
ncbi:MAG: TIGR03905 family TSCPD domain-containing protein [Oscillospiraceae bacterium]|jgi:uncharacterized protein (TIGR03905 family)|nr:TIGR03905 family TSCPD domain-containing protein [Oscillospiraceae bacterium]